MTSVAVLILSFLLGDSSLSSSSSRSCFFDGDPLPPPLLVAEASDLLPLVLV